MEIELPMGGGEVEVIGEPEEDVEEVGAPAIVAKLDQILDILVDDEELEESHNPPNVAEGREPGRGKKNINTGQKTIDEERIREIAKVALKHFRTNSKR